MAAKRLPAIGNRSECDFQQRQPEKMAACLDQSPDGEMKFIVDVGLEGGGGRRVGGDDRHRI